MSTSFASWLSAIDIAVVLLYLASTLIVGWLAGKSIRNVREYTLGYAQRGVGSGFSDMALIATLVATLMNGASVIANARDTFVYGFPYLLICATIALPLFVAAWVIIPKMAPYLAQHRGELGLGEVMTPGDLMFEFYGKVAQIVTGCAGALLCGFYVAMQILAISTLIDYFFDFPYELGLIISYAALVFYTCFGGIKAVVRTDGVQYAVFFVALPMAFLGLLHHLFDVSSFDYLLGIALLYLISLLILGFGKGRLTIKYFLQYTACFMIIPLAVDSLYKPLGSNYLSAFLEESSLLQFVSWIRQVGLVAPAKQILSWEVVVALMVINSIPFLDPAFLQRIFLSSSVEQARRCFCRAGLIIGVLQVLIALMGVMALALGYHVAADNVFLHMVQHHMPVALRGVVIAGLLAAVMSTADSYLNIAGVSLARDVLKPLVCPRITDAQELVLARRVTFIIGGIGLVAAACTQRILALCMIGCSCWAPVVVAPLYAGIFGYRASSRTFILGVLAGQVTFWSWLYVMGAELGGLMAIVPAMLANGAVFFLARCFDPVAQRQRIPLGVSCGAQASR